MCRVPKSVQGEEKGFCTGEWAIETFERKVWVSTQGLSPSTASKSQSRVRRVSGGCPHGVGEGAPNMGHQSQHRVRRVARHKGMAQLWYKSPRR